MPAPSFEDVLTAPDNEASRKRLAEVASQTVSAFAAYAPSAAVTCLREFCNNTQSHLRRRWLGLALVKMVATSPIILDQLATPSGELIKLGHVVLGKREMEETRILAGVLIRLALDNNVRFDSLWPSSKKMPSTIPFPANDGMTWMVHFQEYVDSLTDLALLPRPGGDDYDICYAAAISASDDFRLFPSSLMVVITQSRHLTIISSDAKLHGISFVDVPLQHVRHLEIKQAVLHDSQALNTKHDAWDIVLNLRGEKYTYLVNSNEHSGHTLTLTVPNSSTAEQCRAAISQYVSSRQKVSTSQEIYVLGGSDGPSEHGAAEKEKRSPRTSHPRMSTVPPRNPASPVTTGLGLDTMGVVGDTTATRQDSERSLRSKAVREESGVSQTSSDTNAGLEETGVREFVSMFPTSHDDSGASMEDTPDEPEKINHQRALMQKETAGTDRTLKTAVTASGATAQTLVHGKSSKPSDAERHERDQVKNPKVVDKDSFPNKSLHMERSSMKTKQDTYAKTHVGTSIARSVQQAVPTRQSAVIKQQNPAPGRQSALSESRPNVNGRQIKTTKQQPAKAQSAKVNLRDRKRPANRTDVEGQTAPDNESEATSGKGQPESKQVPHIGGVSTGPGLRPTALKLPKSMKHPRKPQASKAASSAEVDIFAIPIDNDGEVKPRRKRRKVAMPVTYNEESESESENESFDPEYVENKSKTARRSVKQAVSHDKNLVKRRKAEPQTTTKSTKAKKPSSSLGSEARSKSPEKDKSASMSNTKETKVISQTAPNTFSNHISDKTPGLLPRAVPSSQPLAQKHARARHISPLEPPKKVPATLTEVIESPASVGGDNTLVDDVPQTYPSSPLQKIAFRSEAHLLDLLNDDEEQQRPSQAPKTAESGRTSGVSGRLSAADRTPAPVLPTPQQQKVPPQLLSTPEANRKKAAVATAATTIAPSRIVEDPVSPSTETKRGRRLDHSFSTQTLKIRERNAAVQSSKTPTAGFNKQQYKTQTPSHQRGRQTPGSKDAEVLSSNSKPVPASPHAASTAISGHADRDRMEMEKEIGDFKTAKTDPFTQPQFKSSQRSSEFFRRLTDESPRAETTDTPSKIHAEPTIVVVSEPAAHGASGRGGSDRSVRVSSSQQKVRRARSSSPTEASRPIKRQRKSDPLQNAPPHVASTQPEESIRNMPAQLVDVTQPVDVHGDAGVGMDGDDTLVADEESELPGTKAIPVDFPSSPPPVPSSHSSTSAHSSSASEQEPLSAIEQAEEQSWEASLQPHHRAVEEQLRRVSDHVLRHIVKSEVAVEDIADEYSRDGTELLNNLVDRHSGKFESVLASVRQKKKTLKDELERLATEITHETLRYK